MVRIVLPGEFITSSEAQTSDTKSPKLIGYGLEKRNDGVYSVIPGLLNENDSKIWLTTSAKRYIPNSGDRVLGIVTAKFGDYFRVDIGGADLGLLNFTAFEGATKRNRPNVKVGDLLYGLITVTSKYLDPEVSCVDAEGRARGFGVISTPGLLLSVSMNYARKLLSINDKFRTALGAEIKFETAIGMNGRIWISGGLDEVLAVREAILQGETIFESNIPLVVKNAVDKVKSNQTSLTIAGGD